MQIIMVVGRTGSGKTTFTMRLSEKPALLVPHYAIIPVEKIKRGKYKSLIIDDAGLRSPDDWEIIKGIVHYTGRRFLSQLWIVCHYFTQVPPDIRSALTQIWIGKLDRNLLPQNYKNLAIPDENLVFFGYGDDTRRIRLDIKRR